MTRRLFMQNAGTVLPLSLTQERHRPPLLSSAATPWAGIPFEVHEVMEDDTSWAGGPLPGDRGMLVPLEGRCECTVLIGGHEVTFDASPGCIGFSEGGQVLRVERMRGPGKAVAFNLSPVWHGRMVAEGGPASFATLPPIAASETARLLVATICSEVASRAPSGAMFAETLSLALLCYAVEHIGSKPMRVRGSLTAGQQRRLVAYIDERLHEDLPLTEVAALTGLRPRQFSTLFRQAFGVTPHQYLIERRLEQGARLLAQSQTDVAEIALSVGFSSQSHFGVAFRKRYGVTPREYAVRHRSKTR